MPTFYFYFCFSKQLFSGLRMRYAYSLLDKLFYLEYRGAYCTNVRDTCQEVKRKCRMLEKLYAKLSF